MMALLLTDAPPAVLTADGVMARAATENFPVASRFLPRRVRAHLLAVYGFARLADELGDRGDRHDGEDGRGGDPGAPPHGPRDGVEDRRAGERLAALDELERDLDRAYAGRAEHPLLARLAPTLRACALPREPFARLIEANRVEQRVNRYETWEELRAYCALSADPVGELVLGVLDLATPARIARSNSICTALQLAEHCQDVAEDIARDHVYLPLEDLARCGCTLDELRAAHAGAPLREALAYELARARALLADGAPLIDELHGRPRLAVAAFVAGGHAALDAIERAGYDVLPGPPRAGRVRRALALATVLAGRRR